MELWKGKVMDSVYKKMHSTERRKFYWNWEVKTQDLITVLERAGLKHDGYGQWSNDTIGFRYMRLDTNSYLTNLSLVGMYGYLIYNKKTSYSLGYRGFPDFGSYITDLFVKKYCDLNPDDYGGDRCKAINYTDKDKEEWIQIFLGELETGIKETQDRIILKNKKETVKKKVQQIENEVDFAILDYVEDHKEKGISIKQDKSITAAYEWTIEKRLTGYGNFHGPKIVIRKMNTGRYMIKYLKTTGFSDLTPWQYFKAGATKDDIMDFIKSYFQNWLDVPLQVQYVYLTANLA